MDKFYISVLNRSSISDLVEAEKICFPLDAWTAQMFESEFKNEISVMFGIYYCENNEFAGYTDILCTGAEAYLSNIAIMPPYRRQGAAKLLIEYCLNFIKSKSAEYFVLDVRTTNYAAINLYSNLSFSVVSRRKHYYDDGEDAFTMIKQL
ncbi:MAG: N-acetyltransferase [Clostridia bacterium]